MNTVVPKKTSLKCLRTWQGAANKLRSRFQYNSRSGTKELSYKPASCRSFHILRDNESSDEIKNDNSSHHCLRPIQTSMNHTLLLHPMLSPSSLAIYQNNQINTMRHFSTGHPTDENHNPTPNSTRKEKMKVAAKKGQKVVKKGAISIKEVIQKHGFSFVGTYFIIWLTTALSFFGALDSGLIDPMTLMNVELPWHSGQEASAQDASDAEEITSAIDYIVSKMKNYEFLEPYADIVKDKPRISNFAMAVVATKFTEPLRIAVTLAIVPKISKMRGIKVDDDDDTLDKKEEQHN